MEIPAEELLDVVCRAIDGALEGARAVGAEIEAVAIATFWHSVLGLDASGSPLLPLLSWADARARPALPELALRVDADALHRRTGCFLHPSYPSAKLFWLRRSHPQLFARGALWLGFGEFLPLRLFGEARCSFSMASGMGLLDVRRLCWDEEILETVGLRPADLPPLVDTDAPFRGLAPPFAARWPELARIPWFPALGDGACANVGSGAIGRERVGLTIGTSAAVRVVADEEAGAPAYSPALWRYRLDRKRWVVGAALSNGGNGIASLQRLLGLPPPGSPRQELLERMEPDAHGLTILPFLVGERTPGWQQQTHAAIVGLTHVTPPLELLRAWLEAIAFRLAGAFEALEGTFGAAEHVYAGGGALHASHVWTRILTDVLGRPLVLSAEPETTSRGAALMALEQLGLIPDLSAAPDPGGTPFEPDPEHHLRYQKARARQRSLADVLLPWMAGVADT